MRHAETMLCIPKCMLGHLVHTIRTRRDESAQIRYYGRDFTSLLTARERLLSLVAFVFVIHVILGFETDSMRKKTYCIVLLLSSKRVSASIE